MAQIKVKCKQDLYNLLHFATILLQFVVISFYNTLKLEKKLIKN